MLKAALIFQSGMVLQRQKQIPVWGDAEPGAEVSVELDGVVARAVTDEKGIWIAELPAREVAEGLCMRISDGQEELLLTDVCVGEVWLAAGQSNMEFYLAFDVEAEQAMDDPMPSRLRFFDFPEISYEGQERDYDYSEFGVWRSCTKEDLPYFSAVGFYFGRDLSEDLQVPVGIIGCNWGGTTACSWMDPAYLEHTEGKVWLEDYEKAVQKLDMQKHIAFYRKNPLDDRTKMLVDPDNIRKMKIGFSREEQLIFMAGREELMRSAAPLLVGPCYERRPGGLYQTMLRKLVPYAVRGVLWYQGESDEIHAEVYETVFSRLIQNWRDLWQEELPFLFVQLAPFGQWMILDGKRFPEIRAAQEQVSRKITNTWMTTTGDCGMYWDIHPKRKRPVGERLALLALGHIYGKEILCDAPEVSDCVQRNEEIFLSFRNGKGLCTEGKAIGYFEVLNEKGKILPISDYRIEESVVILTVRGKAETVRFARTGYFENDLCNRAGIPAAPFEIKVKKDDTGRQSYWLI